MKNPKNKIQSLVITLLLFILCLGVFGNSIFGHPSSLKQFESSKFSGTLYLKQYNSNKDNVPFLPNDPFSEELKFEEEIGDDGSNDNDQDFIAYHKQYQIMILKNCNTATSKNFTHSHLPLFILFHSWKSFLS